MLAIGILLSIHFICNNVCWQKYSSFDTACDVRCTDYVAHDGNIYSVRAFSKLQNDTLFIQIDQCNQVTKNINEMLLKILVFFILCCPFSPISVENQFCCKVPLSMCCVTYEYDCIQFCQKARYKIKVNWDYINVIKIAYKIEWIKWRLAYLVNILSQ